MAGSHILSGCVLHFGTIWFDNPRATGSPPVKSPQLESIRGTNVLMKSNRCSKCLIRPFRANIYTLHQNLPFTTQCNNNVCGFSDPSFQVKLMTNVQAILCRILWQEVQKDNLDVKNMAERSLWSPLYTAACSKLHVEVQKQGVGNAGKGFRMTLSNVTISTWSLLMAFLFLSLPCILFFFQDFSLKLPHILLYHHNLLASIRSAECPFF